MLEIAIWFYAAGAVPIMVLGAIHALYTWRDRAQPHYFAPRSAELLAALQTENARITPGTTLWRAGLGFHFSHSLGILTFAALYLWLALAAPQVLLAHPPLLWAAPVIAGVYALLSWRYWFRIPLMGSLVSTALFSSGLILALTGKI